MLSFFQQRKVGGDPLSAEKDWNVVLQRLDRLESALYGSGRHTYSNGAFSVEIVNALLASGLFNRVILGADLLAINGSVEATIYRSFDEDSEEWTLGTTTIVVFAGMPHETDIPAGSIGWTIKFGKNHFLLVVECTSSE